MSDPQPTGTVHAIAGTANRIVTSLSGAPALLAIILLNITIIVSVVWLASEQNATRADFARQLLTVLERCVGSSKLQSL